MTVFVSFYTGQYKEAAERLRKSLDHLGLSSVIEARAYEGDFVNVTSYKADFIMEMRSRHPGEKICWLDADLVVRRRPLELLHGTWDVIFPTRHAADGRLCYISAVCGFAPTKGATWVLTAWKRNAERFSRGSKRMVDDLTFERAVNRTGGIRAEMLPPGYFAHPVYVQNVNNPVIEQPNG